MIDWSIGRAKNATVIKIFSQISVMAVNDEHIKSGEYGSSLCVCEESIFSMMTMMIIEFFICFFFSHLIVVIYHYRLMTTITTNSMVIEKWSDLGSTRQIMIMVCVCVCYGNKSSRTINHHFISFFLGGGRSYKILLEHFHTTQSDRQFVCEFFSLINTLLYVYHRQPN